MTGSGRSVAGQSHSSPGGAISANATLSDASLRDGGRKMERGRVRERETAERGDGGRDREGEREGERQTDRQTDRETDRQRR